MHITYTGTIPSGSEPFKKTVSTEKETSEPRVHMVKIAPNTSRESVEKKKHSIFWMLPTMWRPTPKP